MSYFSEVYLKLSSISIKALRKKAVLVFNDFESRECGRTRVPTFASPNIPFLNSFWFLEWNIKIIHCFEERGLLNIVSLPLPSRFIYLFERERKWAHTSQGRGRGRLPTEHGAQRGAWPQDPEIMTWTKSRVQNSTDWAPQEPPFPLSSYLEG